MAAVAYRRWSFTTGSNCKALTGKVLVFRIGSRLWEAVAYGGSTVLEKSQYSWNVEEEFELLELVLRRTQNFTIIDQENPKIEQIFSGDHMTTGYIMLVYTHSVILVIQAI